MAEWLGTMRVEPGFPNDGEAGKEPWEIQEGMQTGSPGGFGRNGKQGQALPSEGRPAPSYLLKTPCQAQRG